MLPSWPLNPFSSSVRVRVTLTLDPAVWQLEERRRRPARGEQHKHEDGPKGEQSPLTEKEELYDRWADN